MRWVERGALELVLLTHNLDADSLPVHFVREAFEQLLLCLARVAFPPVYAEVQRQEAPAETLDELDGDNKNQRLPGGIEEA